MKSQVGSQLNLKHLWSFFLTMIVFSTGGCGNGDNGASTSASSSSSAAGTPVQVSVSATDPDNDQLHYRWAVTEGTINNVDAPATTWIVPPGTGLQFAYVVVSDNRGGYTESRAAALTFDQNPQPLTPAADIIPSVPTGNARYIWGSVSYSPAQFGRQVYLPNVTVTLSPGRSTVTDMKGQFFFSNVPNGTYNVTYQLPGAPSETQTLTVDNNTPLPTSPSFGYIPIQLSLSSTLNVAGSVRHADHSFCGIRNEFFTNSSAQNLFTGPISGGARLFTATNSVLSDSFAINHYGDFLIVRGSVIAGTQAKVRITCDNGVGDSAVISLPALGPAKVSAVTLQNSRPIVRSMSVVANGQDVGRPDLPKPRTLFTSLSGTNTTFNDQSLIAEIIHTPGDDAFLTYKGIDTRKSACAYYRAIGAVEGCDANGNPTGAQLTLAQWKSKFNLSPFSNTNPDAIPLAPGTQEVKILYINKADLNFVRDMQAVKLADGNIAYNVCNYPGPQDVNNPLGAPKEIGTETQADIDLAIENARRTIGMVSCVAMDYSAIPGVNGGAPFTKFYIFGPTGKLFLSVSLDGRREKFMPGTCTNCHGGDAYGGRFPDDGSGRPDIKSRWQPFDMANLVFSSQQDMDVANASIKTLNQMLVGQGLETLTTDRTKSLISGWYLNNSSTQNSDFIPVGAPPAPAGQSAVSFYRSITQPMCQTCHAAQRVNENLTDSTKVCGGSSILEQNHTMTNALVPFERFWLDSTLPPKLNLGCNSKPLNHPAL